MWERANGVPDPGCARSDGEIKAGGLRSLRLGDNWVTLLKRAGQPQTRGLTWAWCVAQPRNRKAADVAVLNRGGKVELVASTARDRTAHRISVGDRSAGGDGIHVIAAHWVYAVRKGRVSAVGVAASKLARRPAALRRAMQRVLAARTSPATPKFVPSATASSSRLSGNVLAGTSDPRMNAALAYLCSMQVQNYGAGN